MYTDAQRAALWQSIYEDWHEIYDLRRQHTTDQREKRMQEEPIEEPFRTPWRAGIGRREALSGFAYKTNSLSSSYGKSLSSHKDLPTDLEASFIKFNQDLCTVKMCKRHCEASPLVKGALVTSGFELLSRENAVENARYLVGQNAVQNQGTQNVGNQNRLSIVLEIANHYRNGNVETTPALGNTLQIAQDAKKQGSKLSRGIWIFWLLQVLMRKLRRENANYSLENNYAWQASIHLDLFNMFTQEEQYTKLLEPIPEPHQVPQNDCNVISEVSSVEQGGGTVEQHPPTVEETRAYQ
ncbi:hypothetical protein Tco_0480542 [Tanacetum coccineum]